MKTEDKKAPAPSTDEQGRGRGRRAGTKPAQPPRLSPQDWIDAASELLVQRSVDAINVDGLAKVLGVTRGSFYWHFTDRNDLLMRLLESWRVSATQQIISHFERTGTEPRELIRELLSLPFHGKAASQAAAIELAIRAWARRDDLARRSVDAVDSERLSYVAQCFSALGFDIKEARSRGFILYAYELAESLLPSQGSEEQRLDRRSVIEKMVLQPL